MNSNIFKKGDILLATHREIRKGYHPIVYLPTTARILSRTSVNPTFSHKQKTIPK